MKLEVVKCALCGGDDSEVIFTVPSLRLPDMNFTLRKCKKCDLVFLSPRPTDDEMGDLYQPKFYNAPRQKLVSMVEGLILRERVSFVRHHVKSSKLLDVGCGDGSFITAMSRSGFDAHGIEPYQGASPNIPDSLRLRIDRVPFESAAYPPNCFDVVTLWHVLEHLSRPVEILRRLRSFLKPGGTLILEVPNLASPEARWLGPYWYNLDAPYHFWHFTPKTLEAAVQQAGFRVTTCVTSAATRPVWLLNYLFLGTEAINDWWQVRYPAWRKQPQMTKALSFALCFGSRLIFARTCPMLRLICQKSE